MQARLLPVYIEDWTVRENEVRRVRSQLEPLFQVLYLRWQKVWILRLLPEKWRRAILIRDHVKLYINLSELSSCTLSGARRYLSLIYKL